MPLQYQLFKQCIVYCNNDLKALQQFNITQNINECFQYYATEKFILQLVQYKNKIPTQNIVAKYGYLNVLQWLASPERGEHQTFCTPLAATYAAENGHLHILKWLMLKHNENIMCTRA